MSSICEALAINTALYREEGRSRERQRLSALLRAGGTDALTADLGL